MLANLIGPILAGLLYSAAGKADLQGVRIIFPGYAGCFFAAAVFEIFIKIPKTASDPVNSLLQAIKKDLGESFYFLTSEKRYVFKAILLNAAFVLLIQPLITTGAPFIIRVVLDLGSVLNGLSQDLMGAAGLVGGVIAGVIADKFKTDKNHLPAIMFLTSIAISAIGYIGKKTYRHL